MSAQLYLAVDAIFITRYLGKSGMASQSLVMPVTYLFCSALPASFSIGAVSLISPVVGQNDVKQANEILTQFVYL